jgi:DNA-binding response OmpR family regulator
VALSENPRIIVSDLELEGGSGLEFCQSVKFTHKITPCHFVICTANQTRFAKVMTPGNGVDDCLLKPSGTHDTQEFIARVAMGLLL